MRDILGRLISLELGMLAMTKDTIAGAVDELIKRGDVGQEEGRNLVNELIDRGEKSKGELKANVERMVSEALAKLDIPTRKEINELKNEIAHLRREITKETLEESFISGEEI